MTEPGPDDLADPYLDGTHRWWHLSRLSSELARAQADGWLGRPGVVVDLGCGLGWELGYLVAAGWTGLGVDLSVAALRGAAAMRYAVGRDGRVAVALADVLRLPAADARADPLLDRGCFHYLPPGWPGRLRGRGPAGAAARRPVPAARLPDRRRGCQRPYRAGHRAGVRGLDH